MLHLLQARRYLSCNLWSCKSSHRTIPLELANSFYISEPFLNSDWGQVGVVKEFIKESKLSFVDRLSPMRKRCKDWALRSIPIKTRVYQCTSDHHLHILIGGMPMKLSIAEIYILYLDQEIWRLLRWRTSDYVLPESLSTLHILSLEGEL